MSAQKVAPRDAYMNFAGLELALDASDSSALVEAELPTGLSIRGMLIWLLHMVEFHFTSKEVDYEVILALCTRQGLATMPKLNDDGVIAYAREKGMLTTSGFPVIDRPKILNYLPPIPIATGTISLYARTQVDVATMRDTDVFARMGFTTAPLDAAAYTEIAETWGWA